eukprot:1887338-Pyramimonas_sp.AAC.2
MAERCGREPGTAPYITRSGGLPLGSNSAKAQPARRAAARSGTLQEPSTAISTDGALGSMMLQRVSGSQSAS